MLFRSALVNGGWVQWTAEKRPSVKTAATVAAATFSPKLQPRWVATLDDVKAGISKPGTRLLDARTVAEMDGTDTRLSSRGGVIPSAEPVYWEDLLDPVAKTFKSADDLRALYAAHGVKPTDEVIAYLQVNLRTVYRLVHDGRLPAFRVGRQWRFRQADIDAWVQSQRPAAARGTAASGAAITPTTSTPRTSRSTPTPPHVLVVDDEPDIRTLLQTLLSVSEYAVTTAADGPQALASIRQQSFDLLVIDLKLPGLDGLSVIREAKRLQPALAVIIITGNSSESAAVEAINLGVSGYLVKPFRAPQLLAAVTRALGE